MLDGVAKYFPLAAHLHALLRRRPLHGQHAKHAAAKEKLPAMQRHLELDRKTVRGYGRSGPARRYNASLPNVSG